MANIFFQELWVSHMASGKLQPGECPSVVRQLPRDLPSPRGDPGPLGEDPSLLIRHFVAVRGYARVKSGLEKGPEKDQREISCPVLRTETHYTALTLRHECAAETHFLRVSRTRGRQSGRAERLQGRGRPARGRRSASAEPGASGPPPNDRNEWARTTTPVKGLAAGLGLEVCGGDGGRFISQPPSRSSRCRRLREVQSDRLKEAGLILFE
ncbi:hypothetical protein SKAU_G00324160 [Synaphobranchus kaupii]|uniref:Uncharacterized protein n=1 Tax=Synaphobranchus kaupii TaxID=118154 RepID=A0A9Q1EPA1_SYNKA|nr:hypothetical protein SKAU_G00324160 [Synaphobranchus kaupii]